MLMLWTGAWQLNTALQTIKEFGLLSLVVVLEEVESTTDCMFQVIHKDWQRWFSINHIRLANMSRDFRGAHWLDFR